MVLFIKKNIYSQNIGLIKYSNGSLSNIKLTHGLIISSFIKSIAYPLYLYKINLLGFRALLFYLKVNMIFSDLGYYNRKNTYTKANGTFSQILKFNYDLKLTLIKLPSGKVKFLNSYYWCTLGRNSNIIKKFLVIGKSGINRNSGKNVTVRGVAMNPVDHPHGGRTKTNKPERSP